MFCSKLKNSATSTDFAALFCVGISLVFVYRFDLLLVNANVNAIIIKLLFT